MRVERDEMNGRERKAPIQAKKRPPGSFPRLLEERRGKAPGVDKRASGVAVHRESVEVKELRGSLELGACSRWRVRASRRRRELGARPSLLCRAELRGRVRDVERAGEIAEPRRAACRTVPNRGSLERGRRGSHHKSPRG